MFAIILLLSLVNCVLRCDTLCTNHPTLVDCTSFDDLIDIRCPERLMISDQSPKVLNRADLNGCEDIVYLNIRDCLIGIENGCFDGMDSLTHLIFDKNRFDEISRGWFSSASRITYMSFVDNGIRYIELHAFQHFNKLEKLRITGNKLDKIHRFVFYNLNIEQLSLSKNEISTIENNAFEDLRSLRKLHLDHNNLTTFIAREVLLDSMENLEILWLHNNFLTQLSGFMLEGLDRLRVLTVSYNKISSIAPSTFESTPDLRVLGMKNNFLTTLPSSIFPDTGLTKLNQLYIDNNRLTYLKASVLHKLRTLKSIVIGGNPWQCKCLDYVLLWISENDISYKCDRPYLNGERPICVAGIRDSDECTYRDNSYFYSKYSESISMYPTLPDCLL